jgi:hypothetical protein
MTGRDLPADAEEDDRFAWRTTCTTAGFPSGRAIPSPPRPRTMAGARLPEVLARAASEPIRPGAGMSRHVTGYRYILETP